jgi:phosphatidate cytidylyltransferase
VLRTRVLTAIVLGPIVLLVAWLGEPWLTLGVVLVVVLALIEATDLLTAAGWAVPRGGTVAAGLLVAAGVLGEIHDVASMAGWRNVLAFGGVGLPVAAFAVAIVGLSGLALRHADPRMGLGAWIGSLFAVAWIGVLGPMLVAVGHLWPLSGTPSSPLEGLGLESGTAWLLVLFGVVWSCDTGAYFVGRAIGRRKLHPQVSPGKTVEGYLGGIVVAAAVGAGLCWLLVGLPALVGLVIGGSTAAIAQGGDLAESLLKRAADRKDSGNLFPGHGGVLDRIDSLLFGAPILVAMAFLFGGMVVAP